MNIFASTPFTFLLAYVILAFVVIMLIVAEVSKYRDKVRATAEYERVMRARSMANHPAGKGRVQERTRRMDIVGYDWTSDTL